MLYFIFLVNLKLCCKEFLILGINKIIILQDSYRAVVTVNPVTDASSMIGVTDIPDW